MKSGAIVKLPYLPPYSWDQVAGFLATRAVPGVEHVDDRGYARTVATPDGDITVRVRPLIEEDALELSATGTEPEALIEMTGTARRMFDVAVDPLAVVAALGKDPLLAPLVARCPGLRVVGAWSPFECAVRAVLGQQVSVKAGRTLAARLVARAGKAIAHPEDGLTHVFPSPAALARASIDGLGITGTRVNALRALAVAVRDGTIDFTSSSEDTTSRLQSLPGFGSWTAQYVAARALGERDAFPTADLVLRRMAAGGPTPLTGRELSARAEAWRPWRSYAMFHLWRAAGESGTKERRTKN